MENSRDELVDRDVKVIINLKEQHAAYHDPVNRSEQLRRPLQYTQLNMKNLKRIKLGLGFTDERLQQRPVKDKHIFRAMTHNYGYDIQAEGDRSYYAVRLYSSSVNKAPLADEFSKFISSMPDDLYWGHKKHALRVARSAAR